MALDSRPAEPLTSRQIAKVLASVGGGIALDTEPEEIMDALKHFVEHEDAYVRSWKMVRSVYAEERKNLWPTTQ